VSTGGPAGRGVLAAWVLTIGLLGAACAGPEPATPCPSLSVRPTPTVRVTAAPAVSGELVVSGVEAPRNVPDPCAILTVAEMTEVLGRPPDVAVRRVSEYDWSCEVHVAADSEARVSVTVFVGAAGDGWTDDLVAAGASTAISETLGTEALILDDAAVVFEIGMDLFMLAGIDDDGFSLDDRAHGLLAQRVMARLTGGG
jgi:hypothetical protein